MATISPARVGSTEKRQSSPKRKVATLAEVQAALQKSTPLRRLFASASQAELLLTTFLFTGLFVLLSLSVLFAGAERSAAFSVQNQPVSFTINANASDSQTQSFLQALMRLPQVTDVSYRTKENLYAAERQRNPEGMAALQATTGRNPFTDRVEVSLYSSADREAFFAFLQSPKLASLLQPRFLWEVPALWLEQDRAIAFHQSLKGMFLLLSGLCVVLLLVSSLQFVRARLRTHARAVRTLRLLGAGRSLLYRPFFLELGVLLLLAFVISSLIVWPLTATLPLDGANLYV